MAIHLVSSGVRIDAWFSLSLSTSLRSVQGISSVDGNQERTGRVIYASLRLIQQWAVLSLQVPILGSEYIAVDKK